MKLRPLHKHPMPALTLAGLVEFMGCLALIGWLSLAPGAAFGAPQKPTTKALELQLVEAQHLADAGDVAEAKAMIVAVRRASADNAPLLIEAGIVSTSVGDAATARAIFTQALDLSKRQAAQAGDDGARLVAGLYEAGALTGLGRVDEARLSLKGLLADEASLRRVGTKLVIVAQALVAARQVEEALALLGRASAATPGDYELHDAFVSLSYETRDNARIEAALLKALAAFPKAPEFTVRLANIRKVQGDRPAALALLEPLILEGIPAPSILGELLGLLSGAERGKEHRARYQQLVKERPEAIGPKIVLGVMQHYLHEYKRSNELLIPALALIPNEPRIPMYIGMNYFRDGNKADALPMIALAAEAKRLDPDVYYCRAVVHAEDDPKGALDDLRRYMALTTKRPDVNPSKQKRVQTTVDLIAGCVKSPDPKACVREKVSPRFIELAYQESGSFAREKDKEAPKPGATARSDEAPMNDDSADAGDDGKPRKGWITGRDDLYLGFGILVGMVASLILWRRRKRPSA